MTVKFTKEHEWVRAEGKDAVVGISDYAQDALGDVVFVELPKPGTKLTAGGEAGTIESVKAASEVYAPVDGTVTEINEALDSEPNKVNDDPLGEGWLFKVELKDASQIEDLMTDEDYQAFVKELD